MGSVFYAYADSIPKLSPLPRNCSKIGKYNYSRIKSFIMQVIEF